MSETYEDKYAKWLDEAELVDRGERQIFADIHDDYDAAFWPDAATLSGACEDHCIPVPEFAFGCNQVEDRDWWIPNFKEKVRVSDGKYLRNVR